MAEAMQRVQEIGMEESRSGEINIPQEEGGHRASYRCPTGDPPREGREPRQFT